MYQRKTVTEYVMQGSYGCGWEDLTTEDSLREAKKRLREYDENEEYARHRIITRRVKKEDC